MMKKKSIISLMLIISIISSMFSVSVAFAADTTDTVADTELGVKYNLVYDLGIVDGIPAKVTRGDFAVMLKDAMQMDYAESFGEDVYPFEDVQPGMTCFKAVRALNDIGVIRGGDDNLYRPDDKITYGDALTLIIRALGYEDHLAETSVLGVASNIGLTDDIKSNITLSLSGRDAVVLMYNMFHADIIGSHKYIEEYAGDKSYFYEMLGYDIIRGTVTDDGECSMNGESSIGKNRVVIDGVVYTLDNPVNELFAKSIYGYYYYDRQSGEYHIVSLYVTQENAITIPADDVKKYNNYVYEIGKANKTKRYNLKNDFTLIYNGKIVKFDAALTDERFKELMMPHSGSVRLISTKNDNTYDIVRIVSYYNMVVGKAVTDASGNTVIIDKFDSDKKFTVSSGSDVYVTASNGSKKTIQSVIEDTVIAIGQSYGKEVTYIELGPSYVTASVGALSSNTIKVDGDEYDISYEYKQYLKKNGTKAPNFGEKGTVYFTYDGKFLMYEKKAHSGMMYAVFGKYADSDVPDEGIITVYTEENNYLKLSIPKRVTMDGVSKKKADVIDYFRSRNAELNCIMMKISYNDEYELTAVDFPYEEDDPASISGTESLDSLHYIRNINGESAYNYSDWLGTIAGGKAIVNDDTKFFFLPEGETDISEIEVLSLKNELFTASMPSKKMSAYATLESSRIAEAVFRRTKPYVDATDITAYDLLKLCVVKNIYQGVNEDGDTVSMLELTDGYTNDVYTMETDVAYGIAYVDQVSTRITLGEGDLIRIGVTDNNIIPEDNAVLMYDMDADKMYCTGIYNNPTKTFEHNSFMNPMGYIHSRGDGYIEYRAKASSVPIDDTDAKETFIFGTSNAYVTIITQGGELDIENASIADIYTYKDAKDLCDRRVIILNRYGALSRVFVYR